MDGAKKMGNQYEVSLEARELYLIIAGLILFSILVFILGVFVGRRVERSQAPPAAVSEAVSPEGEAEGSGTYPGAETEAALPPAGEESAGKAPEGAQNPPPGKEQVQYTYYDSLVKGKGVGMQPQPQGEPESQPAMTTPPAPEETEEAAPAPTPVAKTQKKAKPASTKVAAAKKPKAAETAEEGKYTIQISSFLERDQAQNLVRWLRERKYPAFLASAEIPGKGTWHRVRVGRFATKEIAARYQKELEAQIHLRGFVAQMD